MLKKKLLLTLASTLIMAENVFAATSVSIRSAEQDETGSVLVECGISGAAEGQSVIAMASEVNDKTYLGSLIYIDQFKPDISADNAFSFSFSPADWTDKSKAYIVRVGGYGVGTPDSKVIAFYDDTVYTAGDVNADGAVDEKDAAIVLKYISLNYSLSANQEKAADVNGDSSVDLTDVIKMLQTNTAN